MVRTIRRGRSIEQLGYRVTSILAAVALMCAPVAVAALALLGMPGAASARTNDDPLLDAYLEGVDLYRKGEIKAAIPKLRRAVALSEERYGDDSPELALDLNNLAEALRRTGSLSEAEKLLRRAYAIDQSQGDRGGPAAAATLNNLGLVLAAKGDQRGALAAHRAALAAAEKARGPDHPDTARAAYNLALAEAAAGDLPVARALASRAAYVAERSLGERHPMTKQMRATETKLRNMPDTPPGTTSAPAAQVATLPQAAEPVPAARPARASASAAQGERSYAVQLVAVRDEAALETAWVDLRRRFDRLSAAERLPATFVDIEGRGRFYRLLVGPYAARADADALCKGLKQDGGDCRVIIRN